MDKRKPNRVAVGGMREDVGDGVGAQTSRYKVIDQVLGREVRNAFVLLPEVDSAARTALATYGEATRNVKVARYIRRLLHTIHDCRAQRRE